MNKKWFKDGKFVKLSDNEIKDLKPEELAEYTADLNKSVVDLAIEEANRRIDVKFAEFKQIIESSKTKEEVDTKLKEFQENLNKAAFSKKEGDKLFEKMKTLEEVIKTQGEMMTSLGQSGNKSNQPKSLGDLVKDAFIKEGIIKEYQHPESKDKAFKFENPQKVFADNTKIEVKAAVDMTTANTYSGVEVGYQTAYSMRDRIIPNSKDMHALDWFMTTPINEKYFGVFVEKTYTDGSAIVAEGSASGKTSFLFDTVEYKVFEIPTHLRVSEIQLEDVDNLISRINRLVPDRIKSALDGYIFDDAGDNSATMWGMFVNTTNCTDFVPATYAASIESANEIDVIKKMKLSAMLLDREVNMVGLHPTRIDKIEGLKDADKNYLKSLGVRFDDDGNLIRIAGLGVFRNKKIGTGEAVVFNMDAPEIGLRRNITMTMGWDSDDFTKRFRSIMFTIRAAFGVNNPEEVIYCSDIDAAIETMTIVNN